MFHPRVAFPDDSIARERAARTGPLRVCGGGACERKRDCVRWLTRNETPSAEMFPTPPYRIIDVRGADGVMRGADQVCEHFVGREPQ